jgi:RNA polymerase sigma factor (sigma-70 family)
MRGVMPPEKPGSRRGKTNLPSAAGTSTPCSISPDLRDDAALVNASKSGDLSAFDELVKRYYPTLLRTAQTFTHNHEDAGSGPGRMDKSVSESRPISRRFKVFHPDVSHQRERIAHENSGKAEFVVVRRTWSARAPIFEAADPAPHPEELCYAAEVRRIVLDASKRLRPRLREVFILREIEGLSIGQTATRLHANESTVKSRPSSKQSIPEQIIGIHVEAAGNEQLRRSRTVLASP